MKNEYEEISSFKPDEGSVPVGSLREGLEYQYYVTLSILIYVFSEITTTDKIYIEQTNTAPFDDIVWGSNGFANAFQVKKNDPGELQGLLDNLKKISKELSKHIEVSDNKSIGKVIITHLSEKLDCTKHTQLFGYDCFVIDPDFIDKHKLESNLEGCLILCFPNIFELEKLLRDWFQERHGPSGLHLFSRASSEISFISRHNLPHIRVIEQEKALSILSLEKSDICQLVHDQSNLIERPHIIRDLQNITKTNNNVILLGEPGSGKSAILRQLTQILAKQKIIVNSYPFFVGPDDQYALERLGGDFFINNILSSHIIFKSKYHQISSEDVFRLIENIHEKNFIIIDGLDHVGRDKPNAIDDIALIIDKLSKFKKVILVLSVQVISQIPLTLNTLNFYQYKIPDLSIQETKAIFELITKLSPSEDLAAQLNKKSARNPLLLSYIANRISEDHIDLDSLLTRIDELPLFRDINDYLNRLLHGLDNSKLMLLLYLCNLQIGFEKSFFDKIANNLGIKPFEIGEVWVKICHIFRQIGPSRFVIWHYSLEHYLHELGISLIKEPHQMLSELDDCYDQRFYSTQFKIRHGNLSQIASGAKLEALNARMSPLHAQQIINECCQKASSRCDICTFIQCSFTRLAVYKLLNNYDFDEYAFEAISLSDFEFAALTLLMPNTGHSILEKSDIIKNLFLFINKNTNLVWLCDDLEPSDLVSFSILLSYKYSKSTLSLSAMIRIIIRKKWRYNDGLGKFIREATEDENTILQSEIVGLIGQLLALNLSENDFADRLGVELEDLSNYNNLLCKLILSAYKVYISKTFHHALKIYFNNLDLSETDVEDLYLLSNLDNIKLINDKISTIDYSEIISKILEASPYFDRQKHNVYSQKLFSFIICACVRKEQGLVDEVKREVLSAGKYPESALCDIITHIVERSSNWREGTISLSNTIREKRSKIYYVADKIKYFSDILLYYEICINMGIIKIESHKDYLLITELSKTCGNGTDILFNILFRNTKSSFCLESTNHLFKEIVKIRNCDPYKFKTRLDKIAALYKLNDKSEIAEKLALRSYKLRYLYQWHKDGYVFELLDALKMGANYSPELVKACLMKTAGYFSILDFITDGDEERHWFNILMEFGYENVNVEESLVFRYITKKIQEEGSESVWLWRICFFFEAQLNNVDVKLFDSWVNEIDNWFLDSTSRTVYIRRGFSDFISWVIKNVRTNHSWSRSEMGISFKEKVKVWCENYLRTFENKIRKAKGDPYSLQPDFEETVSVAERLLGKDLTFYENSENYETYLPEKKENDEIKEKVSQTQLLSYLEDRYFWTPKWLAGEHKYVTEVLNMLKSMERAEARKCISESLNKVFMSKDYNMIIYSVKLASVLGGLGLEEELKILLEETSKSFIELCAYFKPDNEFMKAMENICFHSLSVFEKEKEN